MNKVTATVSSVRSNKPSSNVHYVPGPVPRTRARKQSGQCMCEVLGKRRRREVPNSAVKRVEVGNEVWEGKPGKGHSLGKRATGGKQQAGCVQGHVGSITARGGSDTVRQKAGSLQQGRDGGISVSFRHRQQGR